MRKKNKSLLWKITKASLKGIGKGFSLSYRYTQRKIKERKEMRKLEKSKIYNSDAIFSNFKIIRQLEGNYDEFERRFYENSVIGLIFGRRGSGKSALGFRILENIHHKTKRKCYALGISKELMPKWIYSLDELEKANNNSVVLVDEGALSFGARESMSSKNKNLAKILSVARHKNLSVFVITQNTGMVDKNILALTDILLIKEGSLLQQEMERTEIKRFYEKAKSLMKNIRDDKRKYAYLIDSGFEGLIEHSLPGFWSENLSKNRV